MSTVPPFTDPAALVKGCVYSIRDLDHPEYAGSIGVYDDRRLDEGDDYLIFVDGRIGEVVQTSFGFPADQNHEFTLHPTDPAIDTRVRFVLPVERFPHFTAPKGAVGTVAYVDGESISVRMDETIEGAEEWDNEVWFMDPRSEFFIDCEVIS